MRPSRSKPCLLQPDFPHSQKLLAPPGLQRLGGQAFKRGKLLLHRIAQRFQRHTWVAVRPAQRLGDNFVNQPQFL